MKYIFFIFTFLPFQLMALEIDEKLTLRIVNTSQSKKTILINRGIEDGLSKGDHAKFFVSSGVVGRGVCIKLSPTRSVWSMYRKVNAGFLAEEQVMKLKITPAVKITNDESRMLVSDDSSVLAKDPRDLGIPLAEGAVDVDGSKITRQLNYNNDAEKLSILERSREIFGMIHYSSFTETASPDNDTSEFKKEVTNLLFRLGGEWYFSNETSWYHRFSFVGTFTVDRHATMSHLGTFVREESSEFAGGFNIYPFRRPSQTYRFIHYFNYMFGLGSTNSTYEGGAENTAFYADESLDASVISNTFGYGVKYYTGRGYGMRMELSYILRGDDYRESLNNISWLKTRIGPRFQVGISYRF